MHWVVDHPEYTHLSGTVAFCALNREGVRSSPYSPKTSKILWFVFSFTVVSLTNSQWVWSEDNWADCHDLPQNLYFEILVNFGRKYHYKLWSIRIVYYSLLLIRRREQGVGGILVSLAPLAEKFSKILPLEILRKFAILFLENRRKT